MKRIVIAFILTLYAASIKAQVENPVFEEYKKKTEAEFKNYSDSVWQAFSEFRLRANEEYAQFMREQWKAFTALQEEQRPTIPEPPHPYEKDENFPIPTLPKRIPVKPFVIPEPSEFLFLMKQLLQLILIQKKLYSRDLVNFLKAVQALLLHTDFQQSAMQT